MTELGHDRASTPAGVQSTEELLGDLFEVFGQKPMSTNVNVADMERCVIEVYEEPVSARRVDLPVDESYGSWDVDAMP